MVAFYTHLGWNLLVFQTDYIGTFDTKHLQWQLCNYSNEILIV